jgi:DHA1 family vesicular acetylcholine transporter-like MFS transporter 3
MIVYFFKSHFERSKAMGIVITSLALGSFMSVPFSGFMFQYVDKKSPFISLAVLAMIDAVLLLISIYYNCNTKNRFFKKRKELQDGSNNAEPINGQKRTPKKYIWSLFLDPYILICAVSLIMANVPLAFTEPTIAIWMKKTMDATESQIGLIWLSGFLPHILGVYITVYLIKRFSQHQWLFIMGGLIVEALACLSIPFISDYGLLFLPICFICFGYGVIDANILPTMVSFMSVFCN